MHSGLVTQASDAFPDAPPAVDNCLESAPARGHIGRIVAGSLIAGLVGGHRARRRTVRRGSKNTSSPDRCCSPSPPPGRRWPCSPSDGPISRSGGRSCRPSFMALAGVSILVVRPDRQRARMGVATSCRRARGLDDRPRSSGSAQPDAGVAAVPGVRGAVPVRCRRRVRDVPRDATDSYAMPGRLIDVGGHKLHINCTGTGSPTVVLEPGLGEPSTAMAWIAPDVAATTRVCVYDRAGRGWSESAGTPQDGVQVATDLHTLLDRAGEQGPYVLAGHSAGGLYVLNFAQLYPDQVAGVALLDSMSPQQYTAIDGWPGFYEMFRRASAVHAVAVPVRPRPGDLQHRLRRPPRRRS